jgi:hypothetical protein
LRQDVAEASHEMDMALCEGYGHSLRRNTREMGMLEYMHVKDGKVVERCIAREPVRAGRIEVRRTAVWWRERWLRGVRGGGATEMDSVSCAKRGRRRRSTESG